MMSPHSTPGNAALRAAVGRRRSHGLRPMYSLRWEVVDGVTRWVVMDDRWEGRGTHRARAVRPSRPWWVGSKLGRAPER